MKLYREYAHQSISMKDDPDLQVALHSLAAEYPVDVAIETGTHMGTGSTRMLAEFFERTRPLMRFVTMEANWKSWTAARQNLKKYAFVDCRWALSIGKEKAIEFIRNDDALKNHKSHPDVFIDDVDDPIGFYTREIIGGIEQHFSGVDALKKKVTSHLAVYRDRSEIHELLWDGEDFLSRVLDAHRAHRPLVVLDSAGGVGHLEFLTTIDRMGDASFALLLDDTHHLKHFRALEHVRSSPRFKLIGTAKDSSWALCVHKG